MGVPRHSTVPRGPRDRKDSGSVMSLLGHGSPEDIPQSQWDLGIRRTDDGDVPAGKWESQGYPTVPRELRGRKNSGTVMSLLGYGSPEDIPQSQGDSGEGGPWHCDVPAWTSQS